MRLDDQVAQARPRRDDDLRRAFSLLVGLGQQGVISGDAGLALGLARPGRGVDPFELVLEGPLAGAFLALLLGQALLFLFQPGRIIALVGNAAAAVQFQNPAGDVVQEIPVMGDQHDGAFIFVEEAFQPGHRLGVQVVGRFVEHQDVGAFQQQPAERHPAALTARQFAHVGIARRTAQGVHGDLDGALQLPTVDGVDLFLQLALFGEQLVHFVFFHGFGEFFADGVELVEQGLGLDQGFHDVAFDVFRRVQVRFLGQVADPNAVRRPGFAAELGFDAGHDLHQRRFTGPVRPQHADLGAGQEGQGDALEDFPSAGEVLLQVLHHIDILISGHALGLRLGLGIRFGGCVLTHPLMARNGGNVRRGRTEQRVVKTPADP